MTKLEIYKIICKTPHKFLSHGIQNLKKNKIFQHINYDFKDANDLYDFLNNENYKCRLNSCKKKKKFKSFTKGYNHFCSLECNNKWLSESRMGKNNPVHRMTPESRKRMGKKNSANLKKLIKEGKFTPCITNSWCHSRYKISFYRNNIQINQAVRSSWEAFFQLIHTNYKYEKLRVPYYYNDDWHTYIVDFIDDENKKAIEIKPKKESLKLRNILKENALNKWCNDNNFDYIKIDEDYFKKITWNEKLLENQPDKKRLLKFRKYFADEN